MVGVQLSRVISLLLTFTEQSTIKQYKIQLGLGREVKNHKVGYRQYNDVSNHGDKMRANRTLQFPVKIQWRFFSANIILIFFPIFCPFCFVHNST